MSGEGRGHATRVRSMVEAMRDEHEIALFCPGDAYELLAPVYQDTDVKVVKIPGLKFYYKEGGKLAMGPTLIGAIKYIRYLRRIIAKLERIIRKEKPDVIVTDFEPALPRASKKCGVPFLSVNHQHFLVANDLSELPMYLRFHSWVMSWVVYLYYSGQAETVISQFYFPPIRKNFKGKVTMTGVLMRPDLLNAKPKVGEHLLVYLRKFASDELLNTLKSSNLPIRIYGLGEKPTQKNLTFCKIDDASFLRDLINCKALVTTAGNQLVGEALYLKKPVLAMPEAKNHEQYINAFYLAQSKAGEWCELHKLTPERLKKFLDKLDHYRSEIDADKMNGNDIVSKTIEKYIK